jgi:hypothetical protein
VSPVAETAMTGKAIVSGAVGENTNSGGDELFLSAKTR